MVDDLLCEWQVHSASYITVEELGNTEVYELLCILGFNNVRKRMSVSWCS